MSLSFWHHGETQEGNDLQCVCICGRAVSLWSWKEDHVALVLVYGEGRSTTWACSSWDWPKTARRWRTAGSMCVNLSYTTLQSVHTQDLKSLKGWRSLSSYWLVHWILQSDLTECLCWQVGDQIVEINGEPTQGITHTRAIELIQAGGTKVLLLLRPGQGLIPDHSKWPLIPKHC